MRFPLMAAALLAAAPGAACAQSINPSGITLPNFQTSALLDSNAPVLTPTALKIPPQRQAAIPAAPSKMQIATNTDAGASPKQ